MDEKGVWRTIKGRRVFIKEGQSLTEAMRASGKFDNLPQEYKKGDIVQISDDYSPSKYFGKYEVVEKMDIEESSFTYGRVPTGYKLKTIEPKMFAGDIVRSNEYRMRIYKGGK